MECPTCHEKLEPVACVPDEQQFTMEVQYEGEFLAASTLGGMITHTEQLLVTVAKDAGANVSVFIKGIEYGDHKARVDFLIVAVNQSVTHK